MQISRRDLLFASGTSLLLGTRASFDLTKIHLLPLCSITQLAPSCPFPFFPEPQQHGS